MHTLRKKWICTRACVPMQRCRKFFAMKATANLFWVLHEHRTGCCLPPTLLQARRNHSPDAVRSRNPSKSTLAHDTVAPVVSHRYHSIIHVDAGLIQFVYGPHSCLAADLTLRQSSIFAMVFAGCIYTYIHRGICVCVCVSVRVLGVWD